MAEAGFSVKQNKTAKSQVRTKKKTETGPQFDERRKVSECIRKLQTDSQLPIQRARMRIRVSVPTSESTRMREKVLENAETVEVDVVKEEEWQVVSLPFNNMKFYIEIHIL